MSNLVEMYKPYILYSQLQIGTELKISEVNENAYTRSHTQKVGDIVKIIELKICKMDCICGDCICKGKVIRTITEDNKHELPNCCYYNFTGLNGERIRYE
jgi:hypothetical protein